MGLLCFIEDIFCLYSAAVWRKAESTLSGAVQLSIVRVFNVSIWSESHNFCAIAPLPNSPSPIISNLFGMGSSRGGLLVHDLAVPVVR